MFKYDYSPYRCPFGHIEKDFDHEIKAPYEGDDTPRVWCPCGFRGPVYVDDPEQLRLRKIGELAEEEKAAMRKAARLWV